MTDLSGRGPNDIIHDTPRGKIPKSNWKKNLAYVAGGLGLLVLGAGASYLFNENRQLSGELKEAARLHYADIACGPGMDSFFIRKRPGSEKPDTVLVMVDGKSVNYYFGLSSR